MDKASKGHPLSREICRKAYYVSRTREARWITSGMNETLPYCVILSLLFVRVSLASEVRVEGRTRVLSFGDARLADGQGHGAYADSVTRVSCLIASGSV